jgi:hypothetical protein
MAGSRPAIFPMLQRSSRLRDLVAVGASPGARAVVLHRAVPAGSGTSRRRNGVADGERERESQRNLGQHGHSPRVEARSSFCELDRGTRRLFPRFRSKAGQLGTSLRVLCEVCRSHQCQLLLQPNEPSHRVAMRQIFGASSAHRVWSCAAIIIFRATPLRQVGSSPIEVTLQVSIVGARSISS